MMSIIQLIPSLRIELDNLCARVATLEGLLGVSGVSAQKSSNSDGSCRMCGITWQLGVTDLPQHMAGKRHKANLARISNPPPSSPKKGTGHTQYRATMCNKDILNGMPQIQGNVLGRLQSITCMKEYKRKSFEELHSEDLRTERGGLAEKSVNKEFVLDEEGGGTTCKENDVVQLKEKKCLGDEKLALPEGFQDDSPAVEVRGELEEAGSVDEGKLERINLVETCVVMLKPDQLVTEELHLENQEVGRKGLTEHSSGSLVVTDGASIKDGCSSVYVKEGTAARVIDEKWDSLAANIESDQRSQEVSEIISIRPRLKGHARKM